MSALLSTLSALLSVLTPMMSALLSALMSAKMSTMSALMSTLSALLSVAWPTVYKFRQSSGGRLWVSQRAGLPRLSDHRMPTNHGPPRVDGRMVGNAAHALT